MKQPSVVLMVIDALRADCAPFAAESPHLRNLGLKRPDLPSLTALTRGAWAFTQAVAHGSYTPSCHASLFTGLLPPEHGVRAFAVTSLSRNVRTLAEALRDAGYATCAMSDQPAFFQPQGLLRGFQTFVTSDDEAFSWWDSYNAAPRLLFLHLWDLHQPYGMPVGAAHRASYPGIVTAWEERLRSKRLTIPAREQAYYEDPDRFYVGLMQQIWQNVRGFKVGFEDYLAGLETFDGGRLKALAAAMSARGILEDSLVVVTSDHGEGRDIPPSNVMKHGSTLADDQIRTPLFMRVPHLPAARPITGQVGQADITPTILDLLGMSAEEAPARSPYSGRSVAPLLHSERLPERPIYAEIWSSSRLAREDPLAHDATAPISLPRHRMLRYPDRKFYLVGKHATIGDDVLTGPAEQLVQRLFHDVLGRIPTADDTSAWLERIGQAAPTAEARRQLVRRFETSGEFSSFPKYAIFDLVRDPLELKPVDARQSQSDWAAYAPQLEAMLELDRGAQAGEPLVSNAADEEIILKRLQDLGYVE